MTDSAAPAYSELMAHQRRVAVRFSLIATGVAVAAVIALLVGGVTSLAVLQCAMCLPFVGAASAFCAIVCVRAIRSGYVITNSGTLVRQARPVAFRMYVSFLAALAILLSAALVFGLRMGPRLF